MSCFDVGEGFSGQCPYVDLEIERLAVLDLCDCIAQQTPGRVGLVALDRVENQYECDQGGGTQRGGEGAQPAAASGGGSFASLVCLIGRCSQDPLFQIGRDRYGLSGGYGFEGLFRLRVEPLAVGTLLQVGKQFFTCCGWGIVVEKQFEALFKILAFHGMIRFKVFNGLLR